MVNLHPALHLRTSCTLSTLPTEIIAAIVSHLPFNTVLLLRRTSTRLLQVINTNDPLFRFKQYDSITTFLTDASDALQRLFSRVQAQSAFLRHQGRGNLGDWVLGRMVRSRLRIVNGDAAGPEAPNPLDGILFQVLFKSETGCDGVGRVRLTVIENFGIEGGVRVYAKSSFTMKPMDMHALCSMFRKWDPGYVTLLAVKDGSLQIHDQSPTTSSTRSSLSSSSSSPPNYETKILFPKSISRNGGYFGNPGMRYIPCDSSLSKNLQAIFAEELVIEFLADCTVGFCPDTAPPLKQDGVTLGSWDPYAFHSPPHDVTVRTLHKNNSREFSAGGAERGEISVCVVGGIQGSGCHVSLSQTFSYLRMLAFRWNELY
ncbi:hypothetical protein BC830DRAFT_1142286, partial [Chytriomyces sp. MP71]